MSPLLKAIIEGNHDLLRDALFVEKWRNVADLYGFTPLEIAHYLGNYRAVKLLGGMIPNAFKLQMHGAKKPVELPLEGFEKALNFRYHPFLTFPSYSFFIKILKQCPYILRCSSIATDNYAWEKIYHYEVAEGKLGPIYIKWIHQDIGYGAFADVKILEGQFVGEYTGIVRQLQRNHPDQNPYCFHYPTKWWSLSYFVVDSLKKGNLTRFFNHSNQPNLKPLCLVDRRLLHLVFVANREIQQGEELTFDYGEDYWSKRPSMKFYEK